MLKKVYQKVGIVLSEELIRTAKTGTAINWQHNEIMKQLTRAGCKDGQFVYQEQNPKNFDIFYYFIKEVEVEDFEVIDHNRYETYLEQVLNKYILKSPIEAYYTYDNRMVNNLAQKMWNEFKGI